MLEGPVLRLCKRVMTVSSASKLYQSPRNERRDRLLKEVIQTLNRLFCPFLGDRQQLKCDRPKKGIMQGTVHIRFCPSTQGELFVGFRGG